MDDKRRNRVAKALLDSGARRVQMSVFECHVEPTQVERLQSRLRRLHKAEEDSIRFYYLCESCRPKIVYFGQAAPTDEPGLIII